MEHTTLNQDKILQVQRGDVYYVNFGRRWGSEQGGRRPALVVQNDIGNQHSNTTVVIPITAKQKALHMPTHVFVGMAGGLAKDSVLLVEQITCVDKMRITDYIGRMDEHILRSVEEAIKVLLNFRRAG